MAEIVNVLLLEDFDSDAQLIERQLKKAIQSVEVKWVQTREEYRDALEHFDPDIVISDHSLPGFNSLEAFRILQGSALDIPFILVTATISEEFAVEMMREGIADYLLKDRLQRLPVALTNALERWRAMREKRESIDRLIQSEKRFRALIEKSHDMIGVTDSNFNPVFASPGYTRITGRTLEEGRNALIDYIHPDDRSLYYSTLSKAMSEPGRYFSLEYRLLHKTGIYIWMEGTVVNMLPDPAINGVLFNLRDVTARKEAEESLRRSQANITAIIENSNVSIYSIDRQFRYLSFNSSLKNSLKQIYNLDIKVGDVVFDFLRLLDPSELPGWERRYTDAFSGNRVEFEKEFTIGEYYACIHFSINPIVEGHYVTGLSCFAWDVTAQKIAARNVAQSEARFRALIENNYDAIVMRDENRKVLYTSPSVKRMLGYAADEEFDVEYKDMVHPDDLTIINQAYTKLTRSPGYPFSISIRLKKKDGHYLWTEGTITNMLDNENVKGIVSNFRDITERKENELQREKITLDLVERNKNLEQYAYIVSHNLRGPVANILGVASLLQVVGVTEEDRENSLQHLFKSAHHLDEVIKDLNMILELRQGLHEQKEEVNLAELLTDIELSIQDLVKKSNVEIVANFTLVDTISTVKSYLYSIFYNLITNSIKYRQEGVRPVVRIMTEREDRRVRIRFVDNGLGIDLSAHGEKVFGLYKRFHIAHAEGKGMGLFMTKTQVEALGGKIFVKSEVNTGTEFIIDL